MGMRWTLGGDRWWPRTAVIAGVVVAGLAGASAPTIALGRVLPDGRGYELVSPADKNGGDASSALATTVDGDRLAFNSSAGFAGTTVNNSINSYVAQRSPDGWTTRSMQPAVGSPNLALEGAYTFADFSSDLSKAISFSRSAALEPAFQNVFVTGLDGSVRWVTAPTVGGATIDDKLYAGRSADGSHIVFESKEEFGSLADGMGRHVWEWVDGRVRLVSVDPEGSSVAGVAGTGSNADTNIGTIFSGTLPEPTVVSADGRRIFFSDQGARLFVREDGVRTVALSLSQKAGSVGQPSGQPVRFAGASDDGSRVYMTSGDQLTNDATSGGGLYRYDLDSGLLHFVSSGATDPPGAQFEGVAFVSRDGTRVYFLAGSQLVPGQGLAGGHNLYVAVGDHVSFITTLSAGLPNASGASADGDHFVFLSTDRLTSFDNQGHSEIYLYTATDHSLRCVSCGANGHVPQGDASFAGAGELLGATYRTHPITDDGGHVFFQTADDLVPQDVNGLTDVYEYDVHDGTTSLISAGTGGFDSTLWVSSPDGNDVFFTTRDSLVGWDIDGGAADVYDARVGGGFPEPKVAVACDADACQSQPTVAPAASVPAPGRSATAVSHGDERPPRLFVRPITTTGRKNALRTGTVTLVVSVEASGTVSVAGRASYGDHRVLSLKSAKWVAKKAGTDHLKVHMPAAALSQARRHHKVTLSMAVTYSKATRPAHVTITLR